MVRLLYGLFARGIGLFRLGWVLMALGLYLPVIAMASEESPQSFTYQGRLMNAAGTTAIADGTYLLRFRILSESGTCLLYSEQQQVATTNGFFSVQIGRPAADVTTGGSPLDGRINASAGGGGLTSADYDPGLSMADVFSNKQTARNLTANGTCSGSYAPAPGEKRKIRVENVTLGVTLTPDQVVSSVPTAIVAETLQGIRPENFVQIYPSGVSTATTLQINTYAVDGTDGLVKQWNGSAWSAVPMFSSSVLRQSGASSGQVLKWNGTVWAPANDSDTFTTATAIGDVSGSFASTLTVVGLQGRPVVATAPTTAQVLAWNGTSWAPASLAGTSGTAGGDLSGLYPSPSVVAIRGTPVSTMTPGSGQLMRFDGTNWGPWAATYVGSGDSAGGDLSGTYPNPSVVKLQGRDVSASVPVTGDILAWTGGTMWAPASLASLGASDFVRRGGDTMSGQLFLPNGSVGAPILGASSQTSTGIYFNPASNELNITSAGALVATFRNSAGFWSKLRHVESSLGVSVGYVDTTPPTGGLIASGSVGFGTNSPSGRLHVQGTSIGDTLSVFQGFSGQTGNLTEWRSSSGSTLSFIDSAGRLNMFGNTITGLAWPSATLDATSKAYVDAQIATVSGSIGASDFVRRTGDTMSGYLMINSSLNVQGNLGLGTTTTTAKLHVEGDMKVFSMGGSNPTMRVDNSGAGTGALTVGAGDFHSQIIKLTPRNGSNIGEITASGSAGLQLSYGTISAFLGSGGITLPGTGIWNAIGNVGVGTTGPQSRLHVVGSTSSTVVGIFRGAASQSANILEFQNSTGSTLSFFDALGALNMNGSSLTGVPVPVASTDAVNKFYADGVSGGLGAFYVRKTGDTMSGPLYMANGSAAAPSFSFTASPTTGLFLAGANTLAISTAGTQTVTFAPSGNVGIGTSSPLASYRLDVDGAMNSRTGVFDLGPSGHRIGGTDNNLNIVNSSNGMIRMLTAGNERLSITNAGNVGIGTTTPDQMLTVAGGMRVGTTSTSSPGTFRWSGTDFEGWDGTDWRSFTSSTSMDVSGFVLRSGDTMGGPLLFQNGSAAVPSVSFSTSPSTGLFLAGANTLAISSAGTQTVTITPSGNVGIGTTSPIGRLDVYNSPTSWMSYSAAGELNLVGNMDTSVNLPVIHFRNHTGDAYSSFGYHDNKGLSIRNHFNPGADAVYIEHTVDSNTLNIVGGIGGYGTASRVGIGVVPDVGTKLQVKSATPNNTSKALELINSSNASLMVVYGDGSVAFGGTMTAQDRLSIDGSNGMHGLSFVRPTDFASMKALSAPDNVTLRLGGGNQNHIDVYSHTEFVARFTQGQRFGLGIDSPSAKIHITSGTTAAGSAPLKFTSGLLMTTPEAGAVEYDGTNLFFTSGNTIRRVIALTSSTSGSDFVQKSGDSMSGSLIIGSSLVTSGNIVSGGILSTTGQIVSGSFSGSAAIDFNNGNTVEIPSIAGTLFTLSNVRDGGVYVLAVADTTSKTYGFASSDCSTFHHSPDPGPTDAGKLSTYSIMRVGSRCFVNWTTGYSP